MKPKISPVKARVTWWLLHLVPNRCVYAVLQWIKRHPWLVMSRQ